VFRRRTAKSRDSVKKDSEGVPRRHRLIKRVIVALVVAFAVIAAFAYDGIRREGNELTAVLEEFAGQVQILRAGTTPLAPAKQMELLSKDVVITGARSTATIIFPDGSGIILEPKTRFVIRLLEFARGWRRDRSFMVETGSAVSHVSRFFGANSQQRICTPTAVTAVRGTGFRVSYLPRNQTTILEVAEGRVEFQCGTNGAVCYAGETVRAVGDRLGAVGALSPSSLSRLRGQLRRLERHDLPPIFLQGPEYRLLGIFDPALQSARIPRGGSDPNALDAARRRACRKSLERLRKHVEALPAGRVPYHINPWTLKELGLDPQERESILDGFAGKMLDSFENKGNRFVITATALDRSATRFSVTGALVVKSVPEGIGPSAASGRDLFRELPASNGQFGRELGTAGLGSRVGPPVWPRALLGIGPVGSTALSAGPTAGTMPELVSATVSPTVEAPAMAVAGISEQVGGLPTGPLTPPEAPIAPPAATAPPPVITSSPPIEGGGLAGLGGAAAGLAAAAAIASQHGSDPAPPEAPGPIPQPNVPELPAAVLGALGATGLTACGLVLRHHRHPEKGNRLDG